jgi:hypothetical protein
MQVAISISQGRLSSATLMRRLRSNSRKNHIGLPGGRDPARRAGRH